jgi:hypothetical protein
MQMRLQSILMLMHRGVALMLEIGGRLRIRLLPIQAKKSGPRCGLMPMVKWTESAVSSSASWTSPRGRYRTSPAFLLDLRRNRIAVAMLARRWRIGNAETAPSLASMNLHDDHVVVVPVGLERLATPETDVGVDPYAMRQALLDRV